MFDDNSYENCETAPTTHLEFTICLAKFYVQRKPWASELSCVSMQRLHEACDKSAN